jgi:serine phosphatase RsbU (regulator of sigma subunit)
VAATNTHQRKKSPSSEALLSTLANDFRVVAADVRERGAERTMSATLASLEGFYLTDADRRRLAVMPSLRRLLHRILWLVKSLLLKLTPARRIMLAAALFFLVAPRIQVQSLDVSFRMPWMAGVLLLALLMLELKDKLVARDELEAGRQVQLALTPDQRPTIPGWQVWLYTQPANDVGGDLVDYLQLDDRRHAVALGDVAGKALPAALLSVKLQATLRALAPQFESLSDLGVGINRILHRDGLPTRFASLVYLLLTANSGRVRVLNAGHMPPLVVRGDAIASMERGSVVLGIMPDATFPEHVIELNAGDTLIVYSDGVTEAMNGSDDFFGDDRLHEVIRATMGLAPDVIGARILAALKAFIGDAVRSDDVSLMVLRPLAAAAEPST